MAMIRKYSYRKLHDLPTKLEADGGITMAVAARDIAKGERLTFSYDTTIAATRIYEKEKTVAAVPDQSLGVTHRRERLLNTLSFLCGCERCVADLADEKAAAKGSAVKGAAAKGAAAKGEVEEGRLDVQALAHSRCSRSRWCRASTLRPARRRRTLHSIGERTCSCSPI
jgi:hypothetical protein